MANEQRKGRLAAAALCLALLALYAAGGALGGAGFRPVTAAPLQSGESVYLELGVSDAEEAAGTVAWLAERYGGRIEDNYRWSEPGESWASISVVLPAANLDPFLQLAATAGAVRTERRASGTGSRYAGEARATVLLVAATTTARQLAPSEPRRLEAPSALRLALAIASSLYQAAAGLLVRLAAVAGRLLLVGLAVLWLLWHSRRGSPRDKSL